MKLLILILFSYNAFASSELLFLSQKDIPIIELCGKIVVKAYQKIGVKAKVLSYPSSRSLQYSTTGVSDGEIARIYEIGPNYKGLQRIPTPLLTFNGVIVYSNPSLKINSLKDLSKYKVGLLRGVIYSKEKTKGYKNRFFANTPLQLYYLLNAGRVDAIILTDYTAEIVAKKHFPKRKYITHKEVLTTTTLHHYVNQKHYGLINKLNSAIEEMKNSGEIDEIKENYTKSIQ